MSGDCWIYTGGNWESNPSGGWRFPGFEQTDGHPLVCISWENAQNYVQWLGEETGQLYRLLSEAEWEYVCRAGTTTRYSWGDEITLENANYDSKVNLTTEVGSYPPNPGRA